MSGCSLCLEYRIRFLVETPKVLLRPAIGAQERAPNGWRHAGNAGLNHIK
jgi:hypothetical protein